MADGKRALIVGGVAMQLDSAEASGVNLFI